MHDCLCFPQANCHPVINLACDVWPQVRGVHQELRSKGAEAEEMVAAAEVKDADNTRLWDQVPILRPLCSLYKHRPFFRLTHSGLGIQYDGSYCSSERSWQSNKAVYYAMHCTVRATTVCGR